MSALEIGSQQMDLFQGTIQTPRKRVAMFASSLVAEVGAQVLPKRGEPFKVKTTRYDTAANRYTVAEGYKALIGTSVVVKEGGVDYSLTPYFYKFVVVDVRVSAIEALVAAHGIRDSTSYSYAPAGRVDAEWTLQAVPAS